MLALFVVPAALVVVAGLLALAAWSEAVLLSPRHMIVATARARRGSADAAERSVAMQYERLLRLAQR